MKKQFSQIPKKIITIVLFSFSSLINGYQQNYFDKEVQFTVCGLTISGTLSSPDTINQHPAIILVAGGYADNRDAEILGFKPFKTLSDSLVKAGYVVLRYDDRGVGKSTGEHVWQYSAFELAEDIIEGINFLKRQSNINPDDIGILGHSFGAMIAPYVASKVSNISFIISLAGPATNLEEQWLEYRGYSLQHSGIPEDEIEGIVNYDRMMIALSRDNETRMQVYDNLRNLALNEYDHLPDSIKSKFPTYDDFKFNTYYGAFSEMIVTPFAQSLLDYSPTDYLININSPVLFVFGENDDSTPLNYHKPLIDKIIATGRKTNWDIIVIPRATHYLTLSYDENMRFVDGFVTSVLRWLQTRKQ